MGNEELKYEKQKNNFTEKKSETIHFTTKKAMYRLNMFALY